DEHLGTRKTGTTVSNERVPGGSVRQTTVEDYARHYHRSLRQALHYQELMNASHLSVEQARGSLPMPQRVREMLDRMPPIVRSLSEVVTGDEIFRRVVERELRSE